MIVTYSNRKYHRKKMPNHFDQFLFTPYLIQYLKYGEVKLFLNAHMIKSLALIYKAN